TIALAGLLAEKQNCLVIDLDPQGNLSTGLGIRVQKNQASAYDVLTDEALSAESAIVRTESGICLIPADISLAKGEKELLGEIDNTGFLKRKLAPLKAKFEFILIDCPPSLGLLTLNALATADSVLIPVQCQFFALEGMVQLLETIRGIKNRGVNENLQVLGILPTMAERKTLTTQDALETLQTKFSGLKIFEAVPKSVQFAESNLSRTPIHRYSKDKKLIKPYQEIAEYVTWSS
ncbi:MAG TPA: ParA family protein, partial [Stenomitos sp.]